MSDQCVTIGGQQFPVANPSTPAVRMGGAPSGGYGGGGGGGYGGGGYGGGPTIHYPAGAKTGGGYGEDWWDIDLGPAPGVIGGNKVRMPSPYQPGITVEEARRRVAAIQAIYNRQQQPKARGAAKREWKARQAALAARHAAGGHQGFIDSLVPNYQSPFGNITYPQLDYYEANPNAAYQSFADAVVGGNRTSPLYGYLQDSYNRVFNQYQAAGAKDLSLKFVDYLDQMLPGFVQEYRALPRAARGLTNGAANQVRAKYQLF